jgi:hypothetical protein
LGLKFSLGKGQKTSIPLSVNASSMTSFDMEEAKTSGRTYGAKAKKMDGFFV